MNLTDDQIILLKQTLSSKEILKINETNISNEEIENILDIIFDYSWLDKIKEQNIKNNIKTITINDEKYPLLLKQLKNPPVVINYKGNIDLQDTITVVGTREINIRTNKIGKFICDIIANEYNIVSGLALGCDTIAHMSCIEKQKPTTAILAHGLDIIYPNENKKLAEQILENNGCLISEYFVNTKPLKHHFINRNYIQIGLSNKLIVLETDIKGGTISTYNFALKENKKIGALYYDNDIPEGNKMMIDKGAYPITTKNIKEFLNG